MREIPCRLVTAEAPFPGFTNCTPETMIACGTECNSSPGFSWPRAEGSGEVDGVNGLGDPPNAVRSLLTRLLKNPLKERLEVGVFPSVMSIERETRVGLPSELHKAVRTCHNASLPVTGPIITNAMIESGRTSQGITVALSFFIHR
jgi:hypothetical protein